MNPEAAQYLEKILNKDPRSLTPDEIAFLRARRDYLKQSQLEEYASVLHQTSEKETVKKNAKTKK